MKTVQEKIDNLLLKNEKMLLGGGIDKIIAQHNAKKMTARERLHLFFDNGFYDELYRFVENAPNTISKEELHLSGDGVITALGAVDGRLIHASSQDFTVMGGSVGWRHSWKICEIMDMASEKRHSIPCNK